ncbi:MAG: hypothetical protein S4CHLAM81_11850 [Chlamydiales bacterium]|nr:hypothetical protein [Chlamydiales bacterium]MCH9635961.1 hypothetical protein [Chlamydiales bacterium]MCH9703237.1 hypothetical protein [Chlamydiota bacterium]
MAAKALLYPTERSPQYSVRFSNGEELTTELAGCLLQVLEDCEVAVPWQKGDFRVQLNRHFHGKRPHGGDRQLYVAMS